ncbi:pilus assembly protein [Limisalsivibrio acetivorans]|uniref:pilus assembly protein n=1 Tax=Limisalsivibrio acetivorans TaxID=1304888 RepID=UPI0003B53854|nr:hypothetical protein [Limisalsivibrio acetivorans]
MKKFLYITVVFMLFIGTSQAAMEDYCSMPPFISAQASPLVMMVMGRDHKLYYEAYNDAQDLDEDGNVDIGYKHSIDYYGYFDSYKCYTYSTSDNRFNPVSETGDKYCGGTGEWSGNFLNWLSMSRMDVLRKVLYGGHRSTDTASETVLEGVYIPRDAHSWGKEYYGADTRDLTPYAAPDFGQCTTPIDQAAWDVEGKVLMVTYEDGVNKGCGTDHANLLNTFDPVEYDDHDYYESIDYSDGQGNMVDHGNYMYVVKIDVPSSEAGVWNFSIISDDGGEVEVDGTVISSDYGCQGYAGSPDVNDGITINLTEGEHRVIVRVREATGQDGAQLHYKSPQDTNYKIFNKTNLDSDSVTMYAPNIEDTSSGICRLKTSEFINTGTPSGGGGDVTYGSSERHLFCVTSDSAGDPHLIKVQLDETARVWEWASKERPVCDDSTLGTPDAKLYSRVKVCDSGIGLEESCTEYSGGHKPTGLLQRFGDGDGSLICSKSMGDSDGTCGSGEGNPIEAASMYFGLITGSYTNNLSGGVVRKNITSVGNEINADGTFVSSIPTEGSIIQTIDRLRTVDFSYSGNSYSNCGWITTRPLSEGECLMWGNPIGEMYFEALRYFAGETSPTSDFSYSSNPSDTDGGLSLPNPGWTDQPYDIFPSCAKPYTIILSDVYPSYDADGVPGTSADLSNYNLSTLYSNMSSTESVSGNYFIGTNGVIEDFICSSKTLSNLDSAEGLCPEEPTKMGTYNTSALAYYANTEFASNIASDNTKNIENYSVAMASPVPEIKINVAGQAVSLVPIGKSTSGSYDLGTYCAGRCDLSYNANGYGLTISNCSSDAYCPSDTIVDFYAESISDSAGKFRINFEDVEQGADHDMDAIVEFTYEVLDNSHVKISLESTYAAGSIDQVMGFVISGTTDDGVYLPVRDVDAGSTLTNLGMPLSWEKTFTVNTGDSTASLLKDPLWYAAKYGGFSDKNGSGTPDLDNEWDEDLDGVPDNYYYITNPLEMEEQLSRVFTDIMKETSSGTSVSILSERKSKGSILNQAVFYPEKDFGDAQQSNSLNWVGQLFSYWFFNTETVQNIREDTINNKSLDICGAAGGQGDYILDFRIDEAGSLQIDKFTSDCNGEIDGTSATSDSSLDDTNYLWEAGEVLSSRSVSTRSIYTNVDNSTLINFDNSSVAAFEDLLGDTSTFPACLGSSPSTLVDYINGYDVSGCRSRTLLNGNIYKLGDIIYSTPLIVDYNDYTMVYTGANDGMLHAFRVGKVLETGLNSFQAGRLCSSRGDCSHSGLGKEEWAFVPKNALPYLRYLPDEDYCHLYYSDLSPYIAELDTNNDGYVDKRILIAGMRLGGGVCGCTGTDCTNPPSDTCPDVDDDGCVGRSAYYAFDVTDPASPQLLWEYTDKDLGYSYSGPAFITRGSNRYVMFTSGPSDPEGSAGMELTIYALKLDSNYGIDTVTKLGYVDGAVAKSALSSYNNAFGGRLFTEGVDFGGDGNTDTVFFGVNQLSGSTWSGNVVGVSIDADDPADWDVGNVFNSAGKPITSSVVHMDCFNMNYIYFGTGRWFFKMDEEGQNANDNNFLYGVNIEDCKDGSCNLNAAHANDEVCDDLVAGKGKFTWKKDLEPKSGSYIMERLISDPAAAEDMNVVFFSTTEPSSDVCAFGGRSRLWGMNCASGRAIFDSCDDGSYKSEDFTSTVFLQLSRGNIEDITADNLTEADNYTTDWYTGITPETPPVIPPGYQGGGGGRLLFWIER